MVQCKIVQDGSGGGPLFPRAPLFRRIRLVPLIGALLLLAGCGSLPDVADFVNPMTWFEDDEAPQAAKSEKDFPKLTSVPERPAAPSLESQQKKIQQGLIADRRNARYTDGQIRREADRRVAAGPSLGRTLVTPPAPQLATATTPPPPAMRPSVPPPPSPVARTAVPPPPMRPSVPPPPPVARTAVPPPVARTAVPPPPVARIAVSPPVMRPSVPPPPVARTAVPPPPPLRRYADRRAAPPVALPPVPALRPAPTPQTALALGPPGQRVKIGTIYFADNSKALRRDDWNILRQVAEVQRNTGRIIRVVGHASGRTRTFDATRRARINYKVSLDRAKAIAAALAGMGVPEEMVQIEGAGDTAPIYAEYTAAGEAANRRAELFILN